MPSSFDSDCYKHNKNHKSLEDELDEIEIEFQNICSIFIFSINQILNEKLFRSNNLKWNKSYALDKNKYLNKNKEDEVDHSQDSNSDILFQYNNNDILLKEIFSNFHFDEIISNHDLNNSQPTFYDPIYLWLEQSYLNRFPCHFYFFVSKDLSLVFQFFAFSFLRFSLLMHQFFFLAGSKLLG